MLIAILAAIFHTIWKTSIWQMIQCDLGIFNTVKSGNIWLFTLPQKSFWKVQEMKTNVENYSFLPIKIHLFLVDSPVRQTETTTEWNEVLTEEMFIRPSLSLPEYSGAWQLLTNEQFIIDHLFILDPTNVNFYLLFHQLRKATKSYIP